MNLNYTSVKSISYCIERPRSSIAVGEKCISNFRCTTGIDLKYYRQLAYINMATTVSDIISIMSYSLLYMFLAI